MKNVTLIGLGGVGGYFGYQLLKMQGSDKKTQINFVARGTAYGVIKEKGLTLLSPETQSISLYPDEIHQQVSNLKKTDIFILCVKEYDLEQLCHQLKYLVTEDTLLLPLMNGVDIYERIRKIIDNGTILPSCVYVASHIKSPGVIEHKGQPGKIFIGKDQMDRKDFPDWLIHLFDKSGINADYMDDASEPIWMKFLFIAPFGLLTARHNVSIGKVLQDDFLKQQAIKIMDEILVIARSKNILLPKNAIEQTLTKAASFPPHTTTSLQLDITQHKPQNELELFAGAILNYANELNIEARVTQKLYNELLQHLNSNPN
jgi:2-dehydropantoate 2-reductase